MFPARQIDSLDVIADKLLSHIAPGQVMECLPNVRIAALLHQATCLSGYALDIFNDIAGTSQALFNRIEAVQHRTEDLISLSKDVLSRFDPLAIDTQSAMDDFGDDESSIFQLRPSRIVSEMVARAQKQPDLSPFNELTRLVAPEADVDFNKYFSDPDMFRRQYAKDLVEQIELESQAKREARRSARNAEREVRRRQNELRNQSRRTDIEYVAHSTISVVAPPSLLMPKPPGEARHRAPVAAPTPTRVTGQAARAIRKMDPDPLPQPPSSSSSPAPPPLVPAPPPSAAPPPPPPVPAPTPIQIGLAQLRKPDPPAPAAQEPKSFLDLIKNREYKLRPPEMQRPLAPALKQPGGDPNTLTLQELMKKAADIRSQVACSSSSSSWEEDSEPPW
jgi:hypothetical protein